MSTRRAAPTALIVAVVTLLGAPSPARAQTPRADALEGSRGATLPPTSAAWIGRSTALSLNPAGLTETQGLDATLHAEGSKTEGQRAGLWAAGGLRGALGAGLSVETTRHTGEASTTRTALGVAVGPPALSAGAAVSWHADPRRPSTLDLGVDLGLQARPLRWLALGAVLRNAVLPATPTDPSRRSLLLAVGVRPVGERLGLAVDLSSPEPWAAPALLMTESRLRYSLEARPVDGLRLLGSLGHGLTAGAATTVQLGLGVDLERLGATQAVSLDRGLAGWQVQARLSTEARPSLAEGRRIDVVSLAGLGEDEAGTPLGLLVGLAPEDRFLALLRRLDRAARDPRLVAVVLKVERTSLGLARASELRDAIVALRRAGKPVYAYLFGAGDPEYLVASACTRIDAAPEALFLVDGLRSQVVFFGEAAERLGVSVDVARVGAYKSLPEQLTRSDMSPQQREALEAYLDAAEAAVAAQVLESRPLGHERWRASLSEGLKTVGRAVELGLVDGLATPSAFEEALRARHPGARLDATGAPAPRAEADRWGRAWRIAVVPVLGSIAAADEGVPSSFLGRSASAQRFVAAMAAAARDPSVAAIVVRVDSGGGDGLASYLMYQAVLDAKRRKPVVASMGDAAASGGYYVAAAADEIYASAATLTGSIGVFLVKPAFGELAARFGVRHETLARGTPTGLEDLFEPWSDAQRTAAQRWVDAFYETFVREVAASRRLPVDRVDAAARGRIWSGRDALERGLVDRLGGLLAATAAARRRAGLPEGADEVEIVPWSRGRSLGGSLEATLARAAAWLPRTPAAEAHGLGLPPPVEGLLQELGRRLGAEAWILGPPSPQARLELFVDVR